MEYLIGVVLALAVAGLGAMAGFDRERVFYPVVLIVVATYYILFAVIGASARILVTEILFATTFLVLAVIGFKKSAWLVAVAMAGHGVFDAVHHLFIANPGMPQWWPGFCMAFDVTLGAWIAVLLMMRRRAA